MNIYSKKNTFAVVRQFTWSDCKAHVNLKKHTGRGISEFHIAQDASGFMHTVFSVNE